MSHNVSLFVYIAVCVRFAAAYMWGSRKRSWKTV